MIWDLDIKLSYVEVDAVIAPVRVTYHEDARNFSIAADDFALVQQAVAGLEVAV